MYEMMPPWGFKDNPPRFSEARQGDLKLKLDLRREVCHLNDDSFVSLTRGEFGLLQFLTEKPNTAHQLEDIREELGIHSMDSLNSRLGKLRKKIAPFKIDTNNRGGIFLQDDGLAPNIVAEAFGISIDKTDRVFYDGEEVRFDQSNHKLREMLKDLLEGHTIPAQDNAANMHFIRKALAEASESDNAPHGLSFIEYFGNAYALRQAPMVRHAPHEPSPSAESTLEAD